MSEINKKEKKEELMAKKEGMSKVGESLWSVYWRRYKKHTLGKIGGMILLFLYTTALLADFLSPFSMTWADKSKSYHPPTSINFFDEGSFRPFVYERRIVNVSLRRYSIAPEHTLRAIAVTPLAGMSEMRIASYEENETARVNEVLTRIANYYRDLTDAELANVEKQIYDLIRSPNKNEHVQIHIKDRMIHGKSYALNLILAKGNKNYVGFFSKGPTYSFLGMTQASRVRFFGSATGGYYMMGMDQHGRDVLSRVLHGGRISLTVGIIGTIISFTIGLLFGGVAGYFGGVTDTIMMRMTEVIMAFPGIYLLFTLRAVFPPNLSSIQVYLLIISILAFIGWAGQARVIRGLVLSLKNEDYVLSAKTMGLSDLAIITRHILPNTISIVIIQATIGIPRYILGEAALSLLGLGIAEPQSSWGLMLSVCRNYRVMTDFPWMLVSGFAIFLAILSWNFFGDGVRDAVDPRSRH